MGQRLQRLRKAAGMSQEDLARAAPVPIGTLRNWEQDRRIPRLDTAAKVAKALGVSLDDLAGDVVGGADEESPAEEPQEDEAEKRPKKKRKD